VPVYIFFLTFHMPLQLFVRVPEINLSLKEYFSTPGSHELLRSLSWTKRKALSPNLHLATVSCGNCCKLLLRDKEIADFRYEREWDFESGS